MDKIKELLKKNVFLMYCFMFVASYVALKLVLPSSVMFMFVTVLVLFFAFHISSSDERLKAFVRPVKDFFVGYEGKGFKYTARLVVLIAVPLIMGYKVYDGLLPKAVAPAAFRIIHPAPPLEFSGLVNPLRSDEEGLEANIKEGARIYYENCHFCHGDKWKGKGHFAHAFNPPPASFDVTTIGLLQESFVYWRVSTGGPGLPNESRPWDSAMPIWQDMLSEKEIWQVILYIYDATGNMPRTWE